jgi:hypothetical protein
LRELWSHDTGRLLKKKERERSTNSHESDTKFVVVYSWNFRVFWWIVVLALLVETILDGFFSSLLECVSAS